MESIEGQGSLRDPLLLLADPFTGGAEWTSLVPLLATAFEVLSESSAASVSASAALGAARSHDQWAEAELLRRNTYPVHLVASTFAAAGAIRLAARRPELLRSLILHEPIVRFPVPNPLRGPPWAEVADRFTPVADAAAAGDGALARRRWRAALEPDETPSPERAHPIPADPDGHARWRAEWGDAAAWSIVAGASEEFLPPVLLLQGERSPAFLHRISDALAAGFPNLTRLTLPGAGPFLPLEEPHRLAGVLLTFCLERNVPSA